MMKSPAAGDGGSHGHGSGRSIMDGMNRSAESRREDATAPRDCFTGRRDGSVPHAIRRQADDQPPGARSRRRDDARHRIQTRSRSRRRRGEISTIRRVSDRREKSPQIVMKLATRLAARNTCRVARGSRTGPNTSSSTSRHAHGRPLITSTARSPRITGRRRRNSRGNIDRRRQLKCESGGVASAFVPVVRGGCRDAMSGSSSSPGDGVHGRTPERTSQQPFWISDRQHAIVASCVSAFVNLDISAVFTPASQHS